MAGGLGTRLSEETDQIPKPMVVLKDKPMVMHIMDIYSNHGFDDFVLAVGYKSEVIKRWLLDLHELSGNIFLNLEDKTLKKDSLKSLNYKISAIDTGLETQTGGRILNTLKYLSKETVMATYGDGLGNVNISDLIKFHRSQGKIATVTAVRPPSRFGQIQLSGDAVSSFGEKIHTDGGWINGGFFVFEPEIADFISGENEPLETGALPRLVENNQLAAFKHEGFWMPMDTLREKRELAELAKESPPPWLNF